MRKNGERDQERIKADKGYLMANLLLWALGLSPAGDPLRFWLEIASELSQWRAGS